MCQHKGTTQNRPHYNAYLVGMKLFTKDAAFQVTSRCHDELEVGAETLAGYEWREEKCIYIKWLLNHGGTELTCTIHTF